MKHGLILDFGGVVTTDFYGALEGFCLREGMEADTIRHLLRDTAEGSQALADVETGRITQRDYETILAKLLDVDAEGLLGRVLADLRPCEPVLALVDRSRAAGIRVAVLSNSWGTGDYDPYDGYDLDNRFDAVVISDQVGLHKPDPAVYHLTAQQLDVPPADCVFVDDTQHNLPPAAALGMTTVYFTDPATGVADITEALGMS